MLAFERAFDLRHVTLRRLQIAGILCDEIGGVYENRVFRGIETQIKGGQPRL